MSVYYKEIPDYLNECLESLANQTLPATEIIIVKDGLLGESLEQILSVWQNKLPIRIVGYEENKGLAYALNYGLQFCSHELIARMDSDDICVPDRFEKQIKCFEQNTNIVLLSGFISEFRNKPNDNVSIRKVPVGNLHIVRYLKKRNAFNHMAVMFKKSAVLSVNSYNGIDGFEDYDLWIKLVLAGYQVDNLKDILVYARIGNDMINRRKGLTYLKNEMRFFSNQRDRRFISNMEYISSIITRTPLRLINQKTLTLFYYIFLRKKS
jgi:glycosyltransferase involved in cell wall biosynthesis